MVMSHCESGADQDGVARCRTASAKTSWPIVPTVNEKAGIPCFYFPQTNDSQLSSMVLDEARRKFLDKKDAELPDDNDLDVVFNLLMQFSVRVEKDGESYDLIGYGGFREVRNRCPLRVRSFFKPLVFARFSRDDRTRINSGALYHYIVLKVAADSLRISLTSLDTSGQGYLSEHDVDRYIFEEIPDMCQLRALDEAFYQFYVYTASRYIFFVLDPSKKGRIKISDLVTSRLMREFSELRHPPSDGEENKSWFSASSVLRVYGSYLKLDKDQNGMLSKAEFAAHQDGVLTDFFVDRLFQVLRTYSGELDYKTFLDIELALEKRDSPQALRFFWKVLDVDECGYVTAYTLHTFFKSVLSKMAEFGIDAVRIEDVTNEIFDMVHPKISDRITLNDLIVSGVGSTVVSILTDINGFWDYDNREMSQT